MKFSTHFGFLSIKKNILPTLCCLFTLCLVLFSKQNLAATKNGLLLWANAVVPSLLPFFIATELLGHTEVVSMLGKLLNRIMRPLFNVPGEGAYAFVMGIISGYPVGAKIVTKFREEKICTKAECERLLAFTNNSGPLFIIGTVGISLLGDTLTGLLLFGTHLFSCFLVGICFRFWKYTDQEKLSLAKTSNTTSHLLLRFSNLGEVLANSIMNAIHTVILIGGFVILFSVILSILESSGMLQVAAKIISPIFSLFGIETSFASPFLAGILELTNGVKQVSGILTKSISCNIVFIAFLLGFGGFSVLLQVWSILAKSDLSIKPYFFGKLLQGSIAAVLTYFIIHTFPIFNLDLTPIFSQNVDKLPTVISGFYPVYMIAIFLLVLGLVGYFSWRYYQEKRHSFSH